MKAGSPLWQTIAADVRLGLNERPAQRGAVPLARRRRHGFDPQTSDGRAALDLVRDDEGLLRWVYHPPWTARAAGRRSWRAFDAHPARTVQQFRFNELGSNELTRRLVELDQWLTPDQGMKRWVDGRLQADARPMITGRTLLLLHGTFSESAMFTSELGATAAGRDLLARWTGGMPHQAVLAFDHPTLSVGAWSNAIDLARALRQVTGPIDVLCHSRGGLVLAWLLRLVAAPVERVVFVGSPLAGTSLAAPDRLSAALDLLANLAELVHRLGDAAAPALPLAGGVATLAKVFGRVLHLGSGLPVLDAGVALVPGLVTQQRVANNLELRQLFSDEWLRVPQMSGIGVAFRPDESNQPLWKIWRRFTHLGDQLKHAGADLIFDGPNDLVVDLPSMWQLGEAGTLPFLDLGTSPITHHTNYFRDERVIAEVRARLG